MFKILKIPGSCRTFFHDIFCFMCGNIGLLARHEYQYPHTSCVRYYGRRWVFFCVVYHLKYCTFYVLGNCITNIFTSQATLFLQLNMSWVIYTMVLIGSRMSQKILSCSTLSFEVIFSNKSWVILP